MVSRANDSLASELDVVTPGPLDKTVGPKERPIERCHRGEVAGAAGLCPILGNWQLLGSVTVVDQAGRRRITIFSLGGTIASTNSDTSTSGVTPQLTGRDLVAALPQVNDVGEVTTVAFRQVPSGDLTFSDLIELADEIGECFESGTDGVVITQGTDTIEEMSFAIDLLVDNPRPVVVTGAMRNPTLAGPDGPANLLAAVRVAASHDARGLGTLVVLNDQIHAARFVRKTHTSSPSTFQSLGAGPLGWVIEERPRIALRVAPLARIRRVPGGEVPAVAMIKCSLGDDGRIIDHVASLAYGGAVVEGFGGGHVPARVVPALARLAERMPVVLASRTGSGELLRATYGFPGSERDLLSRGLLSAGTLDGPKARVLLSLIMMTEKDGQRIRTTFEAVVASVVSSSLTS